MSRKNDQNSSFDLIDRHIMLELRKDGRMALSTLAGKVGLSKSPCQARVKRLVDTGVITGFHAALDPAHLDLTHVAFVEVRLSDTREATLIAFNAAVRAVDDVEECHMIAGAFDYLLKVRTRDIMAFRRVLGEVISTLPHVASTSTHVVMEPIKQVPG